jgi:arylsulfatase A-like enzyme
MILLHGSPVQAGIDLQNANIEDVTPTLLYLMGQPVPSDMDGRVLTNALRPDWIDTARLASVQETNQAESRRTDFSPADEEAVRQRLQDLGYLG